MSERPVLFSAPMVRALLAGTKTQTRRVVKPRKDPDFGCQMAPGEIAGDENLERLSPYGKPSDRLWVRETFAGSIAYERHGYPLKEWGNKIWYVADGAPKSGQWTRPRPSIHMPRCLSRILLEITSVRIERLQDITRGDAMAEGCPFPNMANATSPRDWYAALWEEINGGGSWDANPWVWVLEFKRVEAATGGKP